VIFPEGFKGSLEIWNTTHGSTMREIREEGRDKSEHEGRRRLRGEGEGGRRGMRGR